jgi:hypothetical protein
MFIARDCNNVVQEVVSQETSIGSAHGSTLFYVNLGTIRVVVRLINFEDRRLK